MTVVSLIANGTLGTAVITDLMITSKTTANAFHTGYTLPHSFETIQEVEGISQANTLRQLQVMQGESSNKTRSVNIKMVCAPTIADEMAHQSACANMTTLLLTLCDFEPTSIDREKVPILHYAARTLALAMSCEDFKKYKNRRADTRKAQYYMFNLRNRIEASVAKSLEDERSITAAAPANANSKAADVVQTYVKAADRQLDEGLEHFQIAISGTKEIDDTSIYTKSPFSPESIAAALAMREAASKKRNSGTFLESPHNKGRGDRDKTPSKRDNRQVAAIIVKGSDKILQPPDLPPDAPILCEAHLRDKGRGCQKIGTCSKCHDPPDQWPKALLDCWDKHVRASETMNWNPEVIMRKLLGANIGRTKRCDEGIFTQHPTRPL